MSLRDPEFRESLDGFYATSVLESEPKLPHHLVRVSIVCGYACLLQPPQRMRIAIMQ